MRLECFPLKTQTMKIFPEIGNSDIAWKFLNICLSSLLWMGTAFVFFHSEGKHCFFKQDLQTISRGLHMDLSYILNMQMLVELYLCTLFGSRFSGFMEK